MEPSNGSTDPNETPRRPVRRVVRQRQPANPNRGRRGPAPVVPDSVISPAPAAQTDQNSAAPPALPAPPAPSAPAADPNGPYPCPFCGEEVSAKAVVCRHCHRDLVAGNGARLVLTADKWNTNVPQWMLDQEQQFLQRRSRLRQIRRWWGQGLLGVTMVLVIAIVYRLFTAPPPPHTEVRALGTSRTDTTASALTMESADQRARQAGASPKMGRSAPALTESVASLPAAELVRRFQLDHALADDRYKDHLVRLTGEVKTLDTGAQAPYVTLNVPSPVELRCYLRPTALGKLTRLRPGSQIEIQGRCQGWFNNVVLADCELP